MPLREVLDICTSIPVRGSDDPQSTLAKTLDALERLGLDENAKAEIRYANAHRLLRK